VSAQAGERFVGVDELPAVHLLDALTDRGVQRLAFFVAHVIAVDGLQVHDLTLGQIGGLVEHEPAVVDMSFERLHRVQA
jgi:hypothetical protein